MWLLLTLLTTAWAGGDRDHDGIPDTLDACPDAPENARGFQTFLDGCPLPFTDTDGDGFADEHDACPYEPEPKRIQGLPDGCPMKGDDADGDGISVMYDKCRDAAEDFLTRDPNDTTPNVAERLDGCPLAATTAPPPATAAAPAAPPTQPTPPPTPTVPTSVAQPPTPPTLPVSGATPFGSCHGRVVEVPRDAQAAGRIVFACDGHAPGTFGVGINLVVPSDFPPAGTVGDLMWGPAPGSSDARLWSLFTVPPDGVWKPVHYVQAILEDWDDEE